MQASGPKIIVNHKLLPKSFGYLNRLHTDIAAKRRTKLTTKKSIISDDETDDNEDITDPITQYDVEKPIIDSGRASKVVFQSKGLMNELEDDIIDFKLPSSGSTKADQGKGSQIVSKFKEVISSVLIADFFLIVFFLLWFIAASVSKEFLANAFLLEKFQDIFAPVIQPALGLLMLGSVASGLPFGKDGDKEGN